jgi:hypothetical protein
MKIFDLQGYLKIVVKFNCFVIYMLLIVHTFEANVSCLYKFGYRQNYCHFCEFLNIVCKDMVIGEQNILKVSLILLFPLIATNYNFQCIPFQIALESALRNKFKSILY